MQGIPRKTVAILGAGIQGTCAALALAERGCRVELFDRAPQPVTQASLWNEGKIHLGLIYAKDPRNRTSALMLQGALHFDSALQRLTGKSRPEGLLSAPFRYLVHRTSLLSVDAIAAHFEAVAGQYRTVRDAAGQSYFDHRSDFVWGPMSERDLRADHDAGVIAAGFRTIERSVDPLIVAEMLRQAVTEQHRIRLHPNCHVERVSIDSTGRPSIVVAGEGTLGPYDDVVNALWQERLRVDATAGLHPTRPWLHRHKLAIHIAGAKGAVLPSTTVMLGEYGDIVDFGGGRHYLSWYPACKLGEWRDLQPPTPMVDDAIKRRTLDGTISALRAIVPAVDALDLSSATVDIAGGYIFAWGQTGIADPRSELHSRSDIGVHSHGRYHSIDTGKYGMAPYFADQLADRICGETGTDHIRQVIRAQ